MARLSERAIKALRAGVARAKQVPEGFDMSDWTWPSVSASCGTGGCLAFEITAADGVPVQQIMLFNDGDIMAGGKVPEGFDIFRFNKTATVSPIEYAQGLLGPNVDTDSLFYAENWPIDLEQAYRRAPRGSLDRALVLEQVVERFIAGDGHFAPRAEFEE